MCKFTNSIIFFSDLECADRFKFNTLFACCYDLSFIIFSHTSYGHVLNNKVLFKKLHFFLNVIFNIHHHYMLNINFCRCEQEIIILSKYFGHTPSGYVDAEIHRRIPTFVIHCLLQKNVRYGNFSIIFNTELP